MEKNVIIIEDEPANAARLQRLLKSIKPDMNIVAVLESLDGSLAWLRKNPHPDLFFMDIQLGDGLSLELFDYLDIQVPVIFTTAYNEYVMEAFRVTSIDYLLKPIEHRDLERALDKLQKLEQAAISNQLHQIPDVNRLQGMLNPSYKSRFLVKQGQRLITIPVEDVLGAVIRNQMVYLVSRNEKRYLVDLTLDQIEKNLDPARFFRINRQAIIHLDAIKMMEPYFNSRLLVKLNPGFEANQVVARERVSDFKAWLDR